ncbi:hypothetical protein [Halocatena pleomorpha]|uniref:Uncharacterized protein n=1 Tax=Halocatena pleomorpha TaxID=1785090 RepID=A0A3P3R8X2_9EURY|nr:hypothetical protein [Halocatena pleomorpha]RRJ29488.1 hypothetical protein EIK79_12670 [Halocatena pleomorpha]
MPQGKHGGKRDESSEHIEQSPEQTSGGSSSLTGFQRRKFLKGIGIAGLGTFSVTGISSSTSADSNDGMDVEGDNVYLVFGADTSSDNLDSWLNKRMDDVSSNSSTPYLRYQDVSQLNVAVRGLAVSISIDGGEAQALQRTIQKNSNFQAGEDPRSMSESNEEREETFTNIGNIYVILAEETEQHKFNGWHVSGETYQPDYNENTEIDQEQDVDQINFSLQAAAISIAEGGSRSRARQQNFQKNKNLQAASAFSENSKKDHRYRGESLNSQSQVVNQANISLQGVAIAIAVGEGSVAKALQVSRQINKNAQIKDGPVAFEPMSIKEFAANAEMDGDYSDSDVKRAKDGSSQRNNRGDTNGIAQFQDSFQTNINAQLLALAVAIDESEANATQASYQGNFNAQILESNGNNVRPESTELVTAMNGKKMKDGAWGADYKKKDNPIENNSIENFTQAQVVRQLNVNAQFLAVAVAIGQGAATAEQLNFQRNKNVQVCKTDGDVKRDKKKRKVDC